MSTIYIDASCSTCHGRGKVLVDDGDDGLETCPACRLRSRYIDRAAEEWKALRDEGADELTLRAMAGDR